MIEKIKDTFLLVFMFMILLGIVLVDRHAGWKEKRNAVKEGSLLFSSAPLRINHFSLTRGSLTIECILENERWIIKQPFRCRANNEKIEQLISAIFSLRCIDVITLSQQKIRGVSPAQYGFSPSSIKINIASDDKKYKIQIGDLSPTKNSLYVMQENSDDIFVVHTNIIGLLPVNVEALRDEKLVSGTPDTINKIEIQKLNASPLQIVKHHNEWIIVKPFFARADWFKIKTMLDSFFKMKILSFVSETILAENIYGISDDEYLLKVTLSSPETETLSIIFGRTSARMPDAIYAKRSDETSIMLINGAFVRDISEGLNAVVDSHILFLPNDIINYVSLSDNKMSLTLELYDKDGIKDWFITDPINAKADQVAVNKLLTQLNNLKIMGFYESNDKAVFKNNKILLKITVGTDETFDGITKNVSLKQSVSTNQSHLPKTVRTLLISPSTQDTAIANATFEGETLVYTLSLSALSSLQINPAFYQDKTIFSIQPDKIRRVIIRKNKEEYAFSKTTEGKWQQDKPFDRKLNIHYLSDLINKLTQLKAARFEQSGGKTLSIFGLSEPSFSVTLMLDDEADVFQKTILIGGLSDDMLFYSMIKGQDTIFLLDKTLVETISLIVP